MVYLGRLVGFGLTKNDRLCGVYAVSGRSEPSKMRIAEIVEGELPSVRIGPYGELSPDQEKMRDLIFYDAMKANNGRGRVVISNGKQTGPTESLLQQFEREGRELDFPLAISHGFVDQKGAEPDSYRTPRIAGIMDKEGRAALGIVTKSGLRAEKIPGVIDRGTYIPGAVLCLSTYSGNPADKRDIIVPDLPALEIPAFHIPGLGSEAQAIADNVFDWIDRDFGVCSAAAVWNPDTGRWDLAVRNLHNKK